MSTTKELTSVIDKLKKIQDSVKDDTLAESLSVFISELESEYDYEMQRMSTYYNQDNN